MMQILWENILTKNRREGDLHSFLHKSFLFQDLNVNEVRFLKQIVHLRHFQAGETIFKQGELGVGLYLIFDGSIDIILKDLKLEAQDSPSPDIFITRLNKGDFFGELSLVEEPSYRSASAIATQKTTLIGFFKPDLLQVMQRNPATGNKICLRLSEILGKRLRQTTEKMSQLAAELQPFKSATESKSSETFFTS